MSWTPVTETLFTISVALLHLTITSLQPLPSQYMPKMFESLGNLKLALYADDSNLKLSA